MTVSHAADLLSWPVFAFSVAYALAIARRWKNHQERLPHLFVAVLLVIATAGFLLRPLDSLGLVQEGSRDIAALVIRTLVLIVMGGLQWHLIDRWLDARRARRKEGP